jgi:hypothetical protein
VTPRFPAGFRATRPVVALAALTLLATASIAAAVSGGAAAQAGSVTVPGGLFDGILGTNTSTGWAGATIRFAWLGPLPSGANASNASTAAAHPSTLPTGGSNWLGRGNGSAAILWHWSIAIAANVSGNTEFVVRYYLHGAGFAPIAGHADFLVPLAGGGETVDLYVPVGALEGAIGTDQAWLTPEVCSAPGVCP